MILLVVDTQELIMTDALYDFAAFKSNVSRLISTARAHNVEIVYVRHDDGADQPLSKGKPGYEVDAAFQPMPGERIFDKTVNSPFKASGLLEYLRDKDEKELVVVGLQTDYCIDATVKCGFEHGFQMIVPAGCNTTVDNAFMTGAETCRYDNEFMWNKRYARCVSMEEARMLLER